MFKFIKDEFLRVIHDERGFLGTIAATLGSALAGKAASEIMGDEPERAPTPKRLGPPWQWELRKTLAEEAKPKTLEAIGKAGEPYEGELVAPLTELQKTSLGQLGNYAEQQPYTKSDLYGAAKGELTNTLGGEYDPFKGEYYKAVKKGMQKELSDQMDKMERGLSTGGFYGGTRAKEASNLRENYLTNLGTTMAGLAQQERARRFQAAPRAAQLAQAEGQAIPQRVENIQQLAGLERQQQQQSLNAAYKEYQRQLQSYGVPLNIAQQMATAKFQYYQPKMIPSSGVGPAVAGAAAKGLFRGGGGGNLFGSLMGGETQGRGQQIPTSGGGTIPEPTYGGSPVNTGQHIPSGPIGSFTNALFA